MNFFSCWTFLPAPNFWKWTTARSSHNWSNLAEFQNQRRVWIYPVLELWHIHLTCVPEARAYKRPLQTPAMAGD